MISKISFMVVSYSYLLSKSISEILLDEFGSVKIFYDTNNTDYVRSSIEKDNLSCVIADSQAIYTHNNIFDKKNVILIPILETDEFSSGKYSEYSSISIFDSKKTIVEKIKNIIQEIGKKKFEKISTKDLTVREQLILQMIAKGMKTKDIAESLNISIQTVSTHRKNITSKLDIKSISGLTTFAIINGLIDIGDTDLL